MKISWDSLLDVLRRSELLDPALVESSLAEYLRSAADKPDPRAFATLLCKKKLLTVWQAEKLLQGKHRGFSLGRYRLLSLLGRGGMSSVFLAEHVVMKRRCAVKVLPVKQARNPSYLTRFHREARAVAALDHPNIVRAFDVDHERDGSLDLHFLVMEYIEGPTLFEVVKQRGPLRARPAMDFIRQAALGLQHAHDHGLIHRDIKPENLILDRQGVVKVMDLGLARFFTKDDEQITIQQDERVLGTANYCSPEQAVDSHLVDARSDIYSLGCTLYFLLAGRPPFHTGTLAQRLLAHQTREPSPVEAGRSDIPVPLVALVRRMMAKKPADRVQRVADVAEELKRLLAAWDASTPAAAAAPDAAGPLTLGGESMTIDFPFEGPPNIFEFPELGDGDPQSVVPPKDSPRHDTDYNASETTAMPTLPSALAEFFGETNYPGGAPTSGDAAANWEESSDNAFAAPPAAPPPSPAPRSSPASTLNHSPVIKAAPPASPPPPVAGASAPPLAEQSLESPRPSRPQGPGAPAARQRASSASIPAIKPSADAARRESPGFPPPTTAAPAAVGTSPPKGRLSRRGILAASAAGVILLAAIGWMFRPGRAPEVARPTPSGRSVSVGPNGSFGTIAEAIDYLKRQPLDQAPSPATIVLLEGTQLQESSTLDGQAAKWLSHGLIIRGEAESRAVLNSPSPGKPVLSVKNVDHFRLEGCTLDAAGSGPALQLQGVLVDAVLRDVRVQGFEGVGVEAVGVSGYPEEEILFENTLFRGASDRAVAVRFKGAARDRTQEIAFRNCSFAGPLREGLQFVGPVFVVSIDHCLFDHVGAALQFTQGGQQVQGLAFIQNTLAACSQGIAFAGQPSLDSSAIELRNNLFSGQQGGEVVVRGDVAAAAKVLLASTPDKLANNWSDRDSSGDAGALNIFANGGKRSIEPISFRSTRPESADFLQPAGTAVVIAPAADAPAGGVASYVGARAPER